MRAMRMAEKFGRPIFVFVDTPAAYPGIDSEERGVAEAIAVNLRDMMTLETPVVVTVTGEGGSGGALGIAIGDRILMQEFAIYSVIPPEGCAAILWRDAAKKVEAAEALEADRAGSPRRRVSSTRSSASRPAGRRPIRRAATALLDEALSRALAVARAEPAGSRLDHRYAKFRSMGRLGPDFVDESR